jgi:hypothetical protein
MREVTAMNQIQQLAGHSASRIKFWLPWMLVLALSTGVAYAMNTAAVTALSTNRPSDTVPTVATDVSKLCGLDVDFALYADWDSWLPAGRSWFCRPQTLPGVPGPNNIASRLAVVGPLRATISFVAPIPLAGSLRGYESDIRIDLYCSTSLQQRSADGADFITAAEARHIYQQVCALAGSSD